MPMHARAPSWTQGCCGACWIERYPGLKPTPLLPEHREEETCCFCGKATMSGIYVRVDPAKVDHPVRWERA